MTPGVSDYAYGMKLENTYTGYTEIGGVIWDGAGNFYTAYGGSVPLGTWTHVAMTYEVNPTEATQIRLYQNGVEVAHRLEPAQTPSRQARSSAPIPGR